MKIKSIGLKNVKCFENELIDLSVSGTSDVLPLCILVGANGAGKSSVLKGIVAVMTGMDQRYGGEMLKDSDIYFDADSLEVQLKFLLNDNEKQILNQKNNIIEIIYAHEKKTAADIFRCPQGMEQNEFKKIIQNIVNDMRIGLIMYYDPFRFLSNKNPAGPNLQLEKDAKNNALQSNILSEGANTCRDLELKQWVVNMDYQRLKNLSNENMEIFNHMVRTFNMLMHPLIFRYIDAQGAIIFRDEKSDKDISLDMLSDGFKSVFFIVIDIIRRLSLADSFRNEPFYQKEAIILIDEVDCHIHPKWQKKLLPSLRELFPNCQFIVTTHSPYILDGVPEYSIKEIGEKKIV